MSCNAWNHPTKCNCGWGGESGGGSHVGSAVRRETKIVDGFTWRINRKPDYQSFVNPNAYCPVCNASVYFYQSQFGGRVFFDSLGPPWPKHPCSDNGALSKISQPVHNLVFGPKKASTQKLQNEQSKINWRPLILTELVEVGGYDRVPIPRKRRSPGKFIYVPVGWLCDTPAFWRFLPTDFSMIEVACFRLLRTGILETQVFCLPGWINQDHEFESWRIERDSE